MVSFYLYLKQTKKAYKILEFFIKSIYNNF